MRRTLLVLFLLSAVALLAAARLHPLNVRPGLWECRLTTTQNGQPTIPPDLLAKLSSQQRARLEERMKADSGEKRTSVYKSCITPEKLNEAEGFANNKECKQTVITSTSTAVELHVVCAQNGMKSQGNFYLNVVDPKTVKGTGHLTVEDGSGTTIDSTLRSRWIGAACGNIQ